MVEVFPALNGDCYLIHTKHGLILIDFGYVTTYKGYLKPRLLELAATGVRILRVILTHIDEDHILGALGFFEENGPSTNPKIIGVDQVWFNALRHLGGIRSPDILTETDKKLLTSIKRPVESDTEKQISARQGTALGALLLKHEYDWNLDFGNGRVSRDVKEVVQLADDVTVRLLSPNDLQLNKLKAYWQKELYKHGFRKDISEDDAFDDAFEYLMMIEREAMANEPAKEIAGSDFDPIKYLSVNSVEDKSAKNGSSIAFVLELEGKRLLMLGDAHPSVILASLISQGVSLNFDFVKLSHHGSFANNTPALIKQINSLIYCISTVGTKVPPHPSLETMAWLITERADKMRYFYFNYENAAYRIFQREDLKEKYNYDIMLTSSMPNFEILL